jgi:DNA-binding NarL/FixJ family response regulator
VLRTNGACTLIRVAIVDPNKAFAAGFQRLLRAEGFSAQVFHGATELLKATAEVAPDLVILEEPDLARVAGAYPVLAKAQLLHDANAQAPGKVGCLANPAGAA